MKIDLITPSYAPDFERCRMLCESVQQYVTGIDNHLLVVDKQDEELFKTLEKGRCSVVVKQDILPAWLHILPWSRRWWLSTRGLPVRGWILQQLVKLSVSEWSNADMFMFADSDVFFVKTFDTQSTVSGGAVRLYRGDRKPADLAEPRHGNWDRVATELLSPPDRAHRHFDYISQLNTWRRDVLERLHRRIEQRRNRAWKQVLCNTWDFSEYVLYGVFAERVLGVDTCGHQIDKTEICHCSWHHDVAGPGSLQCFLDRLPKNQPAVLVQSNLGLQPDLYRELRGSQRLSTGTFVDPA